MTKKKKKGNDILILLLFHCSFVSDFAASWTAARQASLSFTVSQSLLKHMSIESMIPSNRILCHPLLLLPSVFPGIRVFSNESALCLKWPSIGASSSVLPVNIQGSFPLGQTGLTYINLSERSQTQKSTYCNILLI